MTKIKNTFDSKKEIKQLNIEQTKAIEVLKQGTKDVLRQKIMAIYQYNYFRLQLYNLYITHPKLLLRAMESVFLFYIHDK